MNRPKRRSFSYLEQLLSQDKIPQITIDFSKIPLLVFSIVVLLFCLLIGYTNYTDLYQKLNALPLNRSELDTIDHFKTTINRGNVFNVNAIVHPILDVTLQNLANGLQLNFSTYGISSKAGALQTGRKNIDKTLISYDIVSPYYGNVTTRLYFYDNPIGPIEQFESNIVAIYVGHTLAKCQKIYPDSSSGNTPFHVCSLSNVCLCDGQIRTLFNYPTIVKEEMINFADGQHIDLVQFNGYYVKAYSKKFDVPVIEGTYSFILAPNQKSENDDEDLKINKIDELQRIYSQMAAHHAYNQIDGHVIYDDKDTFPNDKELNSLFNIEKVNKTSHQCYNNLIFSTPTHTLSHLRNYIINKLPEVKNPRKIIVLNSQINITNIDKLVKVLMHYCEDCERVDINVDDLNKIKDKTRIDDEEQKDENNNDSEYLISKFNEAKFIIGPHNDEAFSRIIGVSKATVIDIIPIGMECAKWIRDLAVKEQMNFVEISTTEKLRLNCPNTMKCSSKRCIPSIKEPLSVNKTLLKKAAEADFDIAKIDVRYINCERNYIYLDSTVGAVRGLCKQDAGLLV
ncbi:hypothetical protein TRFO_42237 [Tritrichomonas foetus]|uniref:Uncharacterized protein n=1 Tax=Tritrichomonas foetus TaxID=1144522 RepID=A0A1J4L1J9_9EUKA|nr:hypothetical protein TRFO_42237 [Tritrichomonas foetus]|eukprot:OHT15844.1 hypothetical protein TRFO_42237 [Tritrichomonas foetus]